MTDDTHTDYEVITKRRRTTYESGAVGTTPRLPKGATKQTAENVYDKEASIEEEEEEVLEEGPALRMPQLAALSDGEGYSAQVKGCNPFTKTNPRFTKCKPCISKIGKGDTCRFVNFRLYRVSAPDSGPWFYPSPIDIVSKDSDFRGRGFDQHFEAKLDVAGKRPTQTLALNIPNRHVLKTTNADELYILKTTAGVLQGIIDHELIVLGYTKTGEKKANGSQLLEPFYRPPSKDSAVVVRQLCDECLTSIFNTYYSCSHCARELCAACYETLKDTVHEAAASVLANQSKPWRAFLSCGLIRSGIFHCKSQFLIMSKLTLQELIGMRKCTEIVLQKFQGDPDVMLEASQPIIHPASENPNLTEDSENYLRLLPETDNAYIMFQQAWRNGQAVVFQGGKSKLAAGWEPTYFIEHYGPDATKVVDCVTKEALDMTVGYFFNYFLDASKVRDRILKLPDWPSYTEFKEKFPDHFRDFKEKAPFEDYSGFVGSRNLAARLPMSFLPPDLGPKMYNAFGSSDAGKEGYGTTPIHLDMADAVNVMMYASTLEPENEGRPAAVWDIYSRNDSAKIREYLRGYAKANGIENIDDPVHDQFFYLNESMRRELFEQYGVVGWRIFQNVGDAVFVPAGSCHQVCNYKDCVKAACDFVSPENLSACVQLTNEFRALSKTHRRREDLLNLKSILWSTWSSCPFLFEEE